MVSHALEVVVAALTFARLLFTVAITAFSAFPTLAIAAPVATATLAGAFAPAVWWLFPVVVAAGIGNDAA